MSIQSFQSFAFNHLDSVLDIILYSINSDNNNNDDKDQEEEFPMYDEELEDLLLSFIEDIFELIVVVAEDASVKAYDRVSTQYDKVLEIKDNLIKNVKNQVGSRLIVACSLLLSFLSIWINVLELSGMRSGKLRSSMRITMDLIKTLEKANERQAKKKAKKGSYNQRRKTQG